MNTFIEQSGSFNKTSLHWINCDIRDEVVVLVLCGPPDDALVQTVYEAIQEKTSKTVLFISLDAKANPGYDIEFLMMKSLLSARSQLKILFFASERDSAISRLLHSIETFQVPYTEKNVGLLLFENDNKKDVVGKWITEQDFFCKTYECHLLDTIFKKEASGNYTNLQYVRYATDSLNGHRIYPDQLPLDDFVNRKIEFTGITGNEYKVYQPQTFKIHQRYLMGHDRKEWKWRSQRKNELYQGIRDAENWWELDYRHAQMKSYLFNSVAVGHSELNKKFENYFQYLEVFEKLPSDKQRLLSNDNNQALQFRLVYVLSKISSTIKSPIVGIVRNIYKLLDLLESEVVESQIRAICPVICSPTVQQELESMLPGIKIADKDRLCSSPENAISPKWRSFMDLEKRKKFVDLEKGRTFVTYMFWYQMQLKIKNLALKLKARKENELYRQMVLAFEESLIHIICETVDSILQQVVPEIIFKHQPDLELLDNVEAFLASMRKWMDDAPRVTKSGTLSFHSFQKWIAAKEHDTSSALFNDLKHSLKVANEQLMNDFQYLGYGNESPQFILFLNNGSFSHGIHAIYSIFNGNVTTIAAQKLAEVKYDTVAVIAAKVDKLLLVELQTTLALITSREWKLQREQVLNRLHKLQDKSYTYNTFITLVKHFFEIHYLREPQQEYAELLEVKRSFDAIEEEMMNYTTSPLNTTWQWGKEMVKAKEYLYATSSGSIASSWINDVARWTTNNLKISGQSPAMDIGYSLVNPMLILANLFVRLVRNWRK